MQCAICEKTFYGRVSKSNDTYVCGSCVLTPYFTKPSASSEDKDINEGLDLSFLKETVKVKDKKSLSPETVHKNLFLESLKQQSTKTQEITMKSIKVKSNYARSRVVSFGKVRLYFDENGDAELPEYRRPLLEAEMRSRPGRYRIVEEAPKAAPKPPVAPVVAPIPAPIPVKLEKKSGMAKVAEVIEKAVKPRKSRKKGSKKSSKKKKESSEE